MGVLRLLLLLLPVWCICASSICSNMEVNTCASWSGLVPGFGSCTSWMRAAWSNQVKLHTPQSCFITHRVLQIGEGCQGHESIAEVTGVTVTAATDLVSGFLSTQANGLSTGTQQEAEATGAMLAVMQGAGMVAQLMNTCENQLYTNANQLALADPHNQTGQRVLTAAEACCSCGGIYVGGCDFRQYRDICISMCQTFCDWVEWTTNTLLSIQASLFQSMLAVCRWHKRWAV